MPKKKGRATATQRGTRAKKKAKVKLEDLPAEAQLSDEDLEQVRGAIGFANYAAYWGSIALLKKATQNPVKFPSCPDGIVKNP